MWLGIESSVIARMESSMEIREKVDVCVIGAGHAGCEAALACARLGLETVIFKKLYDGNCNMDFCMCVAWNRILCGFYNMLYHIS